MGKFIIILLIVSAKFIFPVALIYSPFIFGWGNFILDSIDGDLLVPLGLAEPVYQIIDKSADWLTYVAMIITAKKFNWKIKRPIFYLFILRSLGQLIFFITMDERVFFIFPNFLEPLFLIYATIYFFRRNKAYSIYIKHKILIWSFVIIYKLQDEFVTHIANVDRTELIRKFFN